MFILHLPPAPGAQKSTFILVSADKKSSNLFKILLTH